MKSILIAIALAVVVGCGVIEYVPPAPKPPAPAGGEVVGVPPGTIEAVVTAVGGPYTMPILLGLSVLRLIRNKGASKVLARSVQHLVDDATAEELDTVKSLQTPAAEAIVNHSQGKGLLSKIPL